MRHLCFKTCYDLKNSFWDPPIEIRKFHFRQRPMLEAPPTLQTSRTSIDASPNAVTLFWECFKAGPENTDSRGHLAYSTTDLAETLGRAIQDLVGDHEGGLRASWRTPDLWPTSWELRVVIDLYRDGPGRSRLVCGREGRREHT